MTKQNFHQLLLKQNYIAIFRKQNHLNKHINSYTVTIKIYLVAVIVSG